jgi:hypothetical protein
MFSSFPEFVRRSKPDGKTDSICTKCYSTIATATWEADLDSAELSHLCEPWKLQGFRKQVKRVDPFLDPAKRSGAA